MSSEEIRVLLIEHDRKEGQAIRDMLAKAEDISFDVEWTQQFSKGLERIDTGRIDVVLLDLSLPVSQGPDMLATLRDKAPSVPVVALTDRRDGVAGDKVLAQGAQDYLVKGQITSAWLAHSLITVIKRTKAEISLGYDEGGFRALVQNSKEGIAVVDVNGTIRYTSPAFKQMFGFDPQDSLGLYSLDFIHPDDLAKNIDLFRQVIADPEASRTNELRAKQKDGSWRIVEVTATNRISDPTVAGIVINLRDITERRKAEEESGRQAEFYRQLAEQNPDGLIVVDVQSQVIFQSPGTEDVSGFLSGELEGTLTFDLIHPDDLPKAMQTFMDFLTKPGSPNRVECRYKHKDGTWHYAQAVGTNHLDNPVIKGIIITTRDITEHKMMEEDLKKSKEELKRAMDRLRQLVDELSTPVVQLWSHVLALPLIGVMDDHRAQQIMETLLKRIVETQSELVILDVTGVPSMDTMVINHLVRTIKSASLLGAQCVLVGMKPDLAQSVIQLDLDVSGFVIKRDLEEGLKWAIKTMSDQARDGNAAHKVEAHPQPPPPKTATSHHPSTHLHARS